MNSQLFDKDQLNIEEIFNKFYEVPDYQREYVWRTANVLALLNDNLKKIRKMPILLELQLWQITHITHLWKLLTDSNA